MWSGGMLFFWGEDIYWLESIWENLDGLNSFTGVPLLLLKNWSLTDVSELLSYDVVTPSDSNFFL